MTELTQGLSLMIEEFADGQRFNTTCVSVAAPTLEQGKNPRKTIGDFGSHFNETG